VICRGWYAVVTEMGDGHVIPCSDLIGHEADDGCPCGPEVRPVERLDGSMGWLHAHRSLDGREAEEPAR
jgi:hypothetical protein